MPKLLLAMAAPLAAFIFAPPAAAQNFTSQPLNFSANQFGAPRDGDHHRRDRHDRRGSSDFIWTDGEWAYANNQTFEPDAYNGWWHDRPDRAFPRWMRHNEDCQRMWWSGGGWRC